MEEVNKELLEKWRKWLASEEGLKVMINVAKDFVLGRDEKIELR